MSVITTYFSKILGVFSDYRIIGDTLDILLLTFTFYYLLKFIKETRALTLAKGVLIFILAYVAVNILGMSASSYILKLIVDNILVILFILFAPQIRNVLEAMGTSRQMISFTSLFTKNGKQNAVQYNENLSNDINSIVKAAEDMSEAKIGALIVFEKETPLGEVIRTGTVVDAKISSQIVGNIFYPKSPLHDGAAVIRDGKLYAAGCILPLTSRNKDVAKELGTRHRAAIGITEQSDAVALIVSEETGAISVAENGQLFRSLTDGEAREKLLETLSIEVREEKSKRRLRHE